MKENRLKNTQREMLKMMRTTKKKQKRGIFKAIRKGNRLNKEFKAVCSLMLLSVMLVSPMAFGIESPVIDKGSDYDRISGNEYFWSIRENGTVEIIGEEFKTADYFKIVASSDGKMIFENARDAWEYSARTDTCLSAKGRFMRGLNCIPSAAKQFFSKHEFDPPHPMYARVTEN